MGPRLRSFGLPITRESPADLVLGFDNLAPVRNPNLLFRLHGRSGGLSSGQRRIPFQTANGMDSRVTVARIHLHGGTKGFSHAVWQAEPLSSGRLPAIKLTHRMPTATRGIPVRSMSSVTYMLTAENELLIDCIATHRSADAYQSHPPRLLQPSRGRRRRRRVGTRFTARAWEGERISRFQAVVFSVFVPPGGRV